MTEIKATWSIAQQISRRHTFISLSITCSVFLLLSLGAIIVLKLLGFDHSGLILHQFAAKHSRILVSSLLFFHLVPVNFYAIIKVFSRPFPQFTLKILQNENSIPQNNHFFEDKKTESS